jgi:transcriptional regulator with XRE-family HTH domain
VTMADYHTRWARLEETADNDPERIAIREALAFGKALYDIRTELGLTVAEVAARAAMTEDDIECIEEGGTEPTVPLLRRLARRAQRHRPPHPGTRPGLRLVPDPRRLNPDRREFTALSALWNRRLARVNLSPVQRTHPTEMSVSVP